MNGTPADGADGFESHPAATAQMDLEVCESHKGTLVLGDLLTDEGWAQIEAGFVAVRMVPPERGRTVLDWVPSG